jgi:beta-N-acetylhexosaminidase
MYQNPSPCLVRFCRAVAKNLCWGVPRLGVRAVHRAPALTKRQRSLYRFQLIKQTDHFGKRVTGLDRRRFMIAGLLATQAGAAVAFNPVDVGNLLITGFRGTAPGEGDVDQVREMLAKGVCAGVMLLRRNCTSPEQVLRLTTALRASSPLKPIICIDQEGGKVVRLDSRSGFLDWRGAAEAARSGDQVEDLFSYWAERAGQLAEVGINVNLAPVVDLDLNRRNPIIGKLGRSFGAQPAQVTRLAGIFIRAHRAAGVKTVLKHFPGHGSSIADSHKDIADVTNTWKPAEAKPFQALTQQGLTEGVMNAHLLHPKFSDAPGIPASLSGKSVDTIRTELEFAGPIWTDDMQMAAVERVMPFADAALAAVSAGNTFLIYSNSRKSDTIETVSRAYATLQDNASLLDGKAVDQQIAMAQDFRRSLI